MRFFTGAVLFALVVASSSAMAVSDSRKILPAQNSFTFGKHAENEDTEFPQGKNRPKVEASEPETVVENEQSKKPVCVGTHCTCGDFERKK